MKKTKKFKIDMTMIMSVDEGSFTEADAARVRAALRSILRYKFKKGNVVCRTSKSVENIYGIYYVKVNVNSR